MCTADGQGLGSVAEALRVAHAGLDYLNGPGAALLDPAALGGVLTSLGELRAKFTAAQAGFLRRFDAAGAHERGQVRDLLRLAGGDDPAEGQRCEGRGGANAAPGRAPAPGGGDGGGTDLPVLGGRDRPADPQAARGTAG